MSAALRIALVTDIHHGADTGTKIGSQALPLLRRFCDWAGALDVDLVVEMGDRINDVNRDTDMALTRQVAAAFAGLSVPRVHLLGNHETAKMTSADAETALGQSLASHSRDLGDFHLVFWNADVRVQLGLRFAISEDDLAWLAADLAATERPTMLFSHIPLDDSSMTGNFYFERVASGRGHYSNGAAARDVIERSGKVFLCLAGHVHWNRHTAVDGVHHIAIQSLTESFTCHPQAAGAYALLEVGDDIRLEVFGHDPFAVRLPIKPLGYHWMNLHRDYAPVPAWLSPSMQKALAER